MNLLLSRYNANVFTQERRSWAFPFVGNGPIVSSYNQVKAVAFVIISVLIVTMEVVVLKVIGKLGNCLDGVVVGQGVCRLPEGAIPPLHGYHG